VSDLLNKVESSIAQDIAGKAILFEIGANAGILDFIEEQQVITPDSISERCGINKAFIKDYLEVLKNLNLLNKQVKDVDSYQKTINYFTEKNKVGYISWGMVSCAPLISNTKEFISDFDNAISKYYRSGKHVAQSSKWMGENDFYPHAEEVIMNLNPKNIVDLGCGTCGLLIRLAKKIKDLKGIGVDISSHACEEARSILKDLKLHNRIDVVESPIQKLIENNNFFLNADVVHGGFVFHDLLCNEEATLDKLLSHIKASNKQLTLVVVDAIPFSENEYECSFSSAFSFIHKYYMGVNFLTESKWKTKLLQAGFLNVKTESLGISGGRIFIAK